MVVTAKKWGNGMGIYLSNSMVKENAEFDMIVDPNGDIHLKRKPTFEEMVASIDMDEIRNDETVQFWQNIEPVGREVW